MGASWVNEKGRWLALGSAFLVACNKPPGPATISLSPEQPLTTDDLTVVFLSESADPNAKDTVSYEALWYVDGERRSDLTGMAVAASETTKGEVWKVIVVPTDGELDGPPVASEVVIGNTPPLAAVSVDNAAPLSDADVTASATGTDADSDSLEFAYFWSVGGDAARVVEGATLFAVETEKGEVWTVSAIAHDGEAESDPATASVSIENVAPVVESVAIEPADPKESSTLTAQVSADDGDDDTVALAYAWSVGGVEVQSSDANTLTGALFNKHDVVTVEVTPNDGFTDGAPVTSDPATILNSPPVLASATLDPQEIYESTTVTCVPGGWSDDDGDAEGYVYAWTVDGLDAGVSAATLDGASFNRDQALACAVTPNDGDEDGEAVASTPVVVSNTAPVIGDVTLSPTSPQEGDTITPSIGTTTDDDGDTVSLSYEWFVNSASILSGTAQDTFSDLYFAKGDTISVAVTPNDGTDNGAAVSSSAITAVNTPPQVDFVTLSPTEVYTNTVVNAVATASDADGDSVSLQYAWSSDAGTDLSGETGSTLDGAAAFSKNETITVSVTPVETGDPTAFGASATASVTVLNTPPTAPGIEITPDEPVGGLDDLVCSVDTAATDADDDALTYGFAWEVDGTAYTGTPSETATTSTVSGTEAETGEAWTCSVTADDGAETGPATEATVDVTPMVITHPGGGQMILISAGTFDMGCTPDQSSCSSDESPVHTVTLTHDFYLGTTEVTQAEYEGVIGSNPSSYPSCGASCPVDHVSWYDVAEFANALSAADGLDNCFACSGGTCTTLGDPYTCTGYRLPTEAEWEFAARAGTDLLYAGSDTLDDVGWYNSNSGYNPHPVAQMEPNAWGLYDMSGNVMEWVWDRYAGYSSSPVSDPAGPQSGSSRVNRGGSWLYNPVYARVAYRQGNNPSDRGYSLGFRLARTVP